MKQKRINLIAVLTFIFSTTCNAEENLFSIQTYVTTGVQDYELENLRADSSPVAITMPTLGLGVAFAYKRFSVDLNYIRGFREESKDGPFELENNSKFERDSLRYDTALTVGYQIPFPKYGASVVPFIGVRDSHSEYNDFSRVESNDGGIPTVNEVRGATKIRSNGVYLGVANSWSVSDHALVSAHIAYGLFSGEIIADEGSAFDNADIETTGLSAGAKTKLVLTDALDVGVGLDIRKFDYSEKGGADVFSERVINYQIQLSYVF